ncbi:MAG: putative toxin-antitoxin system toxin component, PIN family [Bacteroidota bacterium]
MKVIIDTNIWISYLIGKSLAQLTPFLQSGEIVLALSKELIDEISEVTTRPKLQKYFPKERVVELFSLLDIIGEEYEITAIPPICRDPKDDFLLALATVSNADYLVSGDKDLLDLQVHHQTKIITATQFLETLGGLEG